MISLVLPSPAKSWFSIIVALILINLAPGSVFGNDYSSCTKSFSCGSFENIGYPFWGSDWPESCGYPGFGLTCRGDDVPEMTIGEVTYQVLEINNNTRNLRLARSDYWENICPQYLRNTTLISGLTYSSDTQNITLYYHCLPSSATRNSLSGDFSCSINGTDNIIGYIMTSLTDSEFNRSPINYTSLETCNSSVSVPVLKSQVPTVEANPNSGNLTQALRAGFDLQWSTADDSTCESCLNTGGQCGQDISSAQFICYCTNGTFPNNCNGTPLSPAPGSAGLQRRHLTETVIIGFVVAGTAIIVLIFFIILWKKTGSLSPRKLIVLLRKQKMDDNASNNIEALITKYGSLAPKRCSYADIKKMTNKFKEKLGQGGFGSVYKGKLPDGRLVAVKVLSESKGNGEEFINEVASISRTSHVNIVALLGFCYERSKRALVYEFMANGSLDKFIYNQTRQLGWKTLYDIALGIARGLEYLHKGCNARILHFDIKPHNILLDENFCPKISDFGLSRLCERKEQSIISITGARGTIGYIAPEVFCRNFGGVSHKSDVYSYGMMVLEMVGGRKNVDVQVSKTSEIYFPSWIYKNLDQTVNLSLHGIIMAEEEEEITRKLIVVSLWCIQSDPSDRPSITKVIEMLQGSLQSLPIPPKPFASSPVRSPSRTSSST